MSDNKLTIRDFQRGFCHYIKLEGSFIVTVRQKQYEVTIKSVGQANVGHKAEDKCRTISKPEEVATKVIQSRLTYGCGCEKELSRAICSKHSRV